MRRTTRPSRRGTRPTPTRCSGPSPARPPPTPRRRWPPRRRRSPPGRRRPASARGAVLFRAAELLDERLDDLARTLTREEGKTLAEAKGEVLRARDILRYFGGEGWRAGGDVLPPNTPERDALQQARAARRRRGHHAVELPHRHPGVEDRAGAGLRQRRRLQAGVGDAADGAQARGVPAGRRPAGRRPQLRHRLWRHRRRRPRRRPRGARPHVHRLVRRRAPASTRARRSTSRASSWRWAARTRRSCWTTPTWTWP